MTLIDNPSTSGNILLMIMLRGFISGTESSWTKMCTVVSKSWCCGCINLRRTAPLPLPFLFRVYVLSPKLCKSRCGPEGSLCFICFHSHLHSLQTISDPHAMYSQREPRWSAWDPTTSGTGSDVGTCVQKIVRATWGLISLDLFFRRGCFILFSPEILIAACGVFKSCFVRKLLTSCGLPAQEIRAFSV